MSANGLSEKISVVAGKIEDISLPEQADVIISEPMGYMLINERMLETYLHAKKFMKPNGKSSRNSFVYLIKWGNRFNWDV